MENMHDRDGAPPAPRTESRCQGDERGGAVQDDRERVRDAMRAGARLDDVRGRLDLVAGVAARRPTRSRRLDNRPPRRARLLGDVAVRRPDAVAPGRVARNRPS
jgi:hypothetical protein